MDMSKEEVRRIIISDMVKKRNSIVPVIGEDTIVYKNNMLPSRCVYHIFGQAKDGSKWVSDEDLLPTFLLSHNHKEFGAIGLTDFLKENEKMLFVLGCNLPNRLSRFLWQPTWTRTAGKLSITHDKELVTASESSCMQIPLYLSIHLMSS